MKKLLALATGFAVLAVAAPAWAHVSVSSPNAKPGGYALLTFQVPNESATASTTKVQVHFPTDTPIASVLVKPHPGWTATTKTTKLSQPITTDDGDTVTEAVNEIDWTADGPASAIKPGQFDQFLVSAGPLPKVTSLAFAAIQTYSDGTVVNWNQTAAPGSAEPDHPKPVLTLTAATKAAAPAKASSSGSDTGALVLAVVALVLAAGALGVSVVTRARMRS